MRGATPLTIKEDTSIHAIRTQTPRSEEESPLTPSSPTFNEYTLFGFGDYGGANDPADLATAIETADVPGGAPHDGGFRAGTGGDAQGLPNFGSSTYEGSSYHEDLDGRDALGDNLASEETLNRCTHGATL